MARLRAPVGPLTGTAWGEDPNGLAMGAYDDERVGAEPGFDLSGCIVAP